MCDENSKLMHCSYTDHLLRMAKTDTNHNSIKLFSLPISYPIFSSPFIHRKVTGPNQRLCLLRGCRQNGAFLTVSILFTVVWMLEFRVRSGVLNSKCAMVALKDVGWSCVYHCTKL